MDWSESYFLNSNLRPIEMYNKPAQVQWSGNERNAGNIFIVAFNPYNVTYNLLQSLLYFKK